MTCPWLSIDLDKIEHNSRTLVNFCTQRGIALTGVTKATCGNPEVAKAMLRGGVHSIADSRLENIRRLKAADLEPYRGDRGRKGKKLPRGLQRVERMRVE